MKVDEVGTRGWFPYSFVKQGFGYWATCCFRAKFHVQQCSAGSMPEQSESLQSLLHVSRDRTCRERFLQL